MQKTNWFPLFLTNFLGVFNDNYLKNLICFVSIAWVAKENETYIISLSAGLMVLPYILFSPYSGKLSRTKSKVKIVQQMKLVEIPIMLISFIGFALENIYIVLFSMFLMGLQSNLFSPAKYGLIRDLGGNKGISFGTGWLEMLTFLGVLIGQLGAGIVSDIQNFRLYILGGLMLFFAVAGYWSSMKIKTNESEVEKNLDHLTIDPFRFFVRSYKYARTIKGLNFVIFGIAIFWLIGSLIQLNILKHKEVLGITNTLTGVIMGLVAISIAAGCWVSGLLSKDKVQLALIPIGGLGMSISMTLIFVLEPRTQLFTILINWVAFFAGLFKVPLNSWIQANVKGRMLGDMLAYNNLSLFTSIAISALIFSLVETNFNTNAVFMLIAFASWAITIITFFKIPDTINMTKEIFTEKQIIE